MGRTPVRVGVVDIGTNSMRLLITGPEGEVLRRAVVTGLGKGVDATGLLNQDLIDLTVGVLAEFGRQMDEANVEKRAAIATSATRDASNRDAFLDQAEEVLGVRPDVIGGEREGQLAYAGATAGLDPGPKVVSDIGGGSTEFVTEAGSVSIDIGSVRLTDRILGSRPASERELDEARNHVVGLFRDIEPIAGDLVGVAGTWTTLAAVYLGLAAYESDLVHHHRLPLKGVRDLVEMLSGLTVEETAEIPSMDPGRAPMILSGALIAECVMGHLGAESALVSESDTLDGLAMELVGLP